MMSEISFQPQTEADFEVLFAHQIAEMRFLNERMQRDREEIDRLKAATDALKVESRRLEAETQAVLSRLKAAF
jgi:hypothetical protein